MEEHYVLAIIHNLILDTLQKAKRTAALVFRIAEMLTSCCQYRVIVILFYSIAQILETKYIYFIILLKDNYLQRHLYHFKKPSQLLIKSN